MTVKELVDSCCNSGDGQIRILNDYNLEDNATFSSISELSKVSYLYNSEVKNWEFIPKKQLGAIEWEFILEVTI